MNSPRAAAADLMLAKEQLAHGDTAAARRTLVAYCARNAGDAQGAWLLATACLRDGDRESALLPLRAANRLVESADVRGTLGAVLTDIGRIDEAVEVCRSALQLRPQSPELHYNLGNALSRSAATDEAISEFARAIRLKPDFALALGNLGAMYKRAGRATEALAALERAVELEPNQAQTRLNLAVLRMERHEPEAALTHFAVALQLRPDHDETLREYAYALADAGDYDRAFPLFKRALERRPQDPTLWFNFGAACFMAYQLEAAVTAYQQVLALRADDAEAAVALGNALNRLKRGAEAIPFLERALAGQPSAPLVHSFLLTAYRQQADWRRDAELVTALVERVNDPVISVELLTLFGASADPLVHRRAVAAYAESLHLRAEPARRMAPGNGSRALRVGYVSPDFREHPVGYSIVEVLERHDRRRVTVIGVGLGLPDATVFGGRLRAACDEFIEMGGRADADVREALYALELDVVVDLAGHTTNARPRLLASRPAPVQVSYLGFPGTVCVPWIDAIIADSYVIPAGAEPGYAEVVERVSGCFFPTDTRDGFTPLADRSLEGLPDERTVLACFVSAARITPDVFSCWMQVLREVPATVLWLQGDATVQRNLRDQAQRHGVEPQRLIFAARRPERAVHLARHALADLFLDVFPYNAHSTARDALWAGLPVLTCSGASFPSRVAGSLLTAAGLADELVTTGLADYTARAIELARDPARIAQLKARLRQGAARLFDTPSLVADLEAIYERVAARRTGEESGRRSGRVVG